MTSIAIVREENQTEGGPQFSAVMNTGTVQSTGKTVGEAIDALMAQLPAGQSGDLAIVVQSRGVGMSIFIFEKQTCQLVAKTPTGRATISVLKTE